MNMVKGRQYSVYIIIMRTRYIDDFYHKKLQGARIFYLLSWEIRW